MFKERDNRKYPRVAPRVNFSAKVQHIDKGDRDYFEGLVEDVSHGGMFIEISRPFPKGSLVVIKFHSKIENCESAVTAKGLVRWTRKWKKPHGMGVDFIEFEGLGNTPAEEWFSKHFQQQ